MQDITKAKCDSSSIPIGTEGRLIDKRDNKVYWVGKLKDGLCWMTQNLDYDGGGILATNFASDDTTARYYNPGEYVYVNSSAASSCSDQPLTDGLKNCEGWKLEPSVIIFTPDVSWSETNDTEFYSATSYMSSDGKMLCTKNANSWLGDITSDYIPCRVYDSQYLMDEKTHYLIGNYYNWMATSIGNICPTGWYLPTSNSTTALGSFGLLVNGLSGSTITVAPYYFVYGGLVYSSKLTNAGNGGYYWSASAYSSTNAYSLSFGSIGVGPSNNANRDRGFSVRCVAR